MRGAGEAERGRVPGWAPPAALTVATLVLGFWHLGRASLWLDEAVSVNLSRVPWHAFVHEAATKEANMSLYYVLLRAWRVFGSSETAIRSLSVMCAAACVPVVYMLARRVAGRGVATVAAGLLTVNGFFIHYAHEARGYTLVALLVTAATLLFARAVERGSAGAWISYGVVAGVALYAHLFAGFVVVAHAVVALLFARRRQAIAGFGVCAAIALPLLLFATRASGGQIAWIPRTTLRTVVPTFKALAGLGGKPLLAVYFLACLAGTVALARARRWLPIAWIAVPVALTFGISLAVPIVRPQYLIVVLPALPLLAAAGAWRGPPTVKAAATTVVAAFAVAALPNMYASVQTHDWRGAERYVATHAAPGDVIVFDQYYGWTPFSYYAARTPVAARSLFPAAPLGSGAIVHERPLSDAVAGAAGSRRVWLVLNNARTDRPAPDLKALLDALRQGHSVAAHAEFQGGVRVTLYASP